MRKLAAAAILSSSFALAGLATPADARVTIAISCSSTDIEMRLCGAGAQAWAKATGNRVTFTSTPQNSNERLALYQQLLAARSGDIDVLQIDVVWPGILANHLIDLRDSIDRQDLERHFPAIVENNTVAGRLVAIPWYTDAGVLYYRKDLLEKYRRPLPVTWQDMTETARLIQQDERDAGQTRMWGYVFQGRAYEGLTVNGIEWLGGETYCYVRTEGEQTIVVRTDGEARIRAGEQIRIGIAAATCHLFDKDGMAIERIERHPMADMAVARYASA